MDMTDAIVRSIIEVSNGKNLNAGGFRSDEYMISWNSDLGSLGVVQFRIPISKFRIDIQTGMRYVSILVAFASLIMDECNRGMIDNLCEAKRRGAKTLFQCKSLDESIMYMTIPVMNNSYGLMELPIAFHSIEDGEYKWEIPNKAEIYAQVYKELSDTPIPRMSQISHMISDYTGLEVRTSQGVPVLAATQSVNTYVDPSYISDTD